VNPWSAFEQAAPPLARAGRELLDRFGFVLLGTVRPDGTPRISPVEAHLVHGYLMLVLIPGTRKAHDVRRDPRITVQTPVTEAADPGGELKLHGRVSTVDDAQRDATSEVIQSRSGWRPAPSWLFLSVDIESAALVEWRDGEMLLTRWDPVHGLRGPQRRRLDPDAGRYRVT
jgi:Pyridoxamine 5'-phosphate oxidase